MWAAQRMCVPFSNRPTKRSLGKALDPRLAPGLPKAASFSAVSATSSVLPSRLTSRQSRYQAPFVRRSAMGATIASYNACIGSAPKRLDCVSSLALLLRSFRVTDALPGIYRLRFWRVVYQVEEQL